MSDALSRMIQPQHLDPRPYREALLAKPYVRYVVIDHFFREDWLAELARRHRRWKFRQGDVGLLYDSRMVGPVPGRHFGADLLGSPEFHGYAAAVAGVSLHSPERFDLRMRRDRADASGFWPHSDANPCPDATKSVAVIGYFNRRWSAKDGGLLQFWESSTLDLVDDSRLFRWCDYEGRRLDFLEQHTSLDITLGTNAGLRYARLRLLDEIVPGWNRVVFVNLADSLAVHSVTPSGPRVRNSLVLWLF